MEKMPASDTIQSMAKVAKSRSFTTDNNNKPLHIDKDEFAHAYDTIYNGWDRKNIPYGQLTELGANQMKSIGSELRRR